METIRNYLESMFRNMPNTPEVRRAKDELWQMMEDKYTELINDGMTENAAVGTVISEFGNLDELSDVLGISHYLPVKVEKAPRTEQRNENENRSGNAGGNNNGAAAYGPAFNAGAWQQAQQRILLREEVSDYLKEDRKSMIVRTFGIFCCIISVTGPIFMDGLTNIFGIGSSFLEALGVAAMFILVGFGVFLICYSGNKMKKWKYIKKEHCGIDYSTAMWLEEMINTEEPRLSMLRVVGIVACCVSVVPVIILDGVGIFHGFFESVGVVMMFLMAGIGVMLILYSSGYFSAAKSLLKANDAGTMGGQFTKMQREENVKHVKSGILSVYWPTVTCIYLCASFLTFEWGRTWLIWPIAGVIHSVIKMNLKAGRK